jgi:hypothetical protein
LESKIVYQTLEDRGADLDILESSGPYPCYWENTWLGDGFYFWDTFIQNAHWWGKEVRQYTNGYIICKAICDYNEVDCFDLVGNTKHIERFHSTYHFLKTQGIANDSTTVGRIIQYLRKDLALTKFHYSAIRAIGIKSKNIKSDYSFSLKFEEKNIAYLDLLPAIQICFFTKKSLNLRDFKIVYPPEYTDDYLV